jgi:superfamily II DNA or RNA helicase
VKSKPDWKRGELRAMDIVLATNMLSVGVDVNRLGLMVVNGQPKSTAEYIQATSRVGRAFPGLVCTVLTWSRPRDLSHYETFEHYHATFYKHVEAQSVTPFAPRALDRGLMGTAVSLLRLGSDDLNPNLGAQEFDDTARPDILAIKKTLSDRAWKSRNKEAKTITEDMVDNKADLWVKEATKGGRRLGYEARRGQGDLSALLKRPSALAWDDFTVPTSMREVEPGVGLIMDASTLSASPSWRSEATREKERR